MKEISRKEFLKAVLYYTISGWGVLGMSRFARAQDVVPSEKQGNGFVPAYLKLHESGALKERGDRLWAIMGHCALCPRACGTDRLSGQKKGFCGSTAQLKISSFHPHLGEEKALVGRNGSGTIFFSNCSLRCVFCINWETNLEGRGHFCHVQDLVDMMLSLQKKGCANINLVTPTHYAAHILKAVDIAAGRGLRLPLVYNTSGWERLGVLKELDGVVDVYLPDFKFFSGEMSARYSQKAANYPQLTEKALLEMNRQVGVARPDPDGVIRRGLIIRHLVMPDNVGGTKDVLAWIAAHLPKDTYVNLMSQYRPFYKAHDYPRIARRITRDEYLRTVEWANQAGLTNVETRVSAMLQ